ncbi:phospholipase B [Lactifluus volemus]|nr:phospholipase B [Lactifluus volemus]
MLLSCYLSTLALALLAYANNGSVTDYAPLVNQPCPDVTINPLVRSFTPVNQSLHPREEDYVNTRLTTVIPNEWQNWVGDGSAIGYNLSEFKTTLFPRIGLAFSGGGARAAQYGAGVLSALDGRNQTSKAAGTGGLLQVSLYTAGLSGGSWLLGSLYMNDFPPIRELVQGNGHSFTGWLLDIAFFTPDGVNLLSKLNQYWYGSILWSVVAKGITGIDTSVTDLWSRVISYHFLNQTTRDNFFTNNSAHGAGQLWSAVPLLPSWQRYQLPFPIIQANSRPVGSNLTTALSPTSAVYEITPMEWGSWDPQLSAMMNMSYAGTHLTNGRPDNDTACVTGFDDTGFMMGTSASLFNQLIDRVHNTVQGTSSSVSKAIFSLLDRQLSVLRTRADDVANWPNPFYNLTGKANFQDLHSEWLELIDGSSNQENLPLGQLFVKARNLDVVVGIDSSAQIPTTNWPNGSALFLNAARITDLLQSSHQVSPPLPGSDAQFISMGVNLRPTFFGCFPTQNPPEYPMLIWFPSSPPLNGDKPVINTPTLRLEFSKAHTQLFLDQVYANAIGGFVPNTNIPDPNFGRCLQCAAIDRARYRINPPLARSDFCTQCFTQYCFDPNNPSSSSELPGRVLAFENPDPQGLSALSSFLSRGKVGLIVGFLFAALVIAAICTFLCVFLSSPLKYLNF